VFELDDGEWTKDAVMEAPDDASFVIGAAFENIFLSP